MNSDKTFNSQMTLLEPFANTVSDDDVKNELMFFNSSPTFAYNNGGPVTRSFIDKIPADWMVNSVFDSRVHMLMPGWFPAIPGYHHDDVPRPTIEPGKHFITAGQPDYDNPRYRSEHIMGLVGGEVCPTHFAIGECTMPRVPDGQLIYRTWHEEVLKLLDNGKLTLREAPDRTLIYFDCDAFHTGSKAIGSGWRWFGRLSRNTDRAKTITNEIRRQVQVYLEFPMEGW